MKQRKVRNILISLSLAGVLIAYVVVSLLAPLPTLSPTQTIEASRKIVTNIPQINWSGYGEQAVGAVGYGLISTNGKNDKLPTASVAKVMAALAVLQKKPLGAGQQGPVITISDADVALYNADNTDNQSIIPVQVGEQLTEYQAIEAMLIPSATNIATTLTNWAFGSQAAYTVFANQYAKTLGMTQSNFADASGYSPLTISTPSDLIALGIAAVQNPVIKLAVNQKTVDLPVVGSVDNFNIDIGVDGINGIKTGNTDQAGGAFLYSADSNGLEIVGVTLGAPDLGTALHDAPEVLDSFKATIKSSALIKANETVGTYKLPWGGTVRAVTAKQLPIIDFQPTSIPLQVKLQKLVPKSYNPATVGTVSFNYQNKQYTSDIALQGAITKPSIWWRLQHP